MKKERFSLRAAITLLVVLFAHITAWAQNSVSTITTTEELVKESTVYVGEVVVDGMPVIKYLYSADMTVDYSNRTEVLNCLRDMADGDYADLLEGHEFDYTATTVGFALCNDADKVSAMDEHWSSAQYVGKLYLPDKMVTSETNSNLYDLDEGFKAAVDADNAQRLANIDNPIDVENGLVFHVDSKATDNVWYELVDGQVIRHADITVTYDCEAATVIYTKVELETPPPLTFEAVEAGTISIENPNALTIEYSKNNSEWTAASTNPISITVAASDVVQFRGNNACYWAVGDSGEEVTRFTATNDCYVYGNVMSLIDKDNFATNTALTEEFALAFLFAAPSSSMYKFYAKNSTIKNHPTKDIVLPATTLTGTCYGYMFAGCEGLTRAPQLPATTLAMGCYHQMFVDCTALTVAPGLPATTLASACYSNMFEGCTALTTASALPATTLADYCYMWMFSGCSALVDAPELPATTLAEDCYHRMFENCTSLQKAPVLPASTLFGQVYGGMFDGCTSLNYVKCLATDIVDTSHGEDATTDSWLANVATTGTFVKADAANWSVKAFTTGERLNGIPESWTVVNASEDEEDDFVATECPLTFEALEDGTIAVNWEEGSEPSLDAIQYRLNDGAWTDVTWGTPIDVAAGDVVSLRGNNGTCYDEDIWAGFHIECSGDCYVYGNMMSLIDQNDFATNAALTRSYTFFHLFQKSDYSANTTLKNHPTKDIVLPATTLTINCYDGLFADCQGITRAPELPATDLAEWCYCMMFSGTNITEAPVLPATTLQNACYSDMFMNCTHLTAAPELPAPTLVEGCYSSMFSGCSSLNYVKCLATDISADYCTTGWLSGVAETGTFVKTASMNDWAIGADESDNVNGVPEGWTVAGVIMLNSDGEGNYWGTWYDGVTGYTADENTTVYTVKLSDDQSKVTLSEVDDKTIPAGNAVVLKSTNATTIMTAAGGASGTLTNNDLLGADTEVTTPDNTYMLVKGGNGVGFYHWTKTHIPAGRGYLTLSSSVEVKEFLPFSDETTGISLPTPLGASTSFEGSIYDLTGRRMSNDTKLSTLNTHLSPGIYIINGRKVVIK